MGRRWRAARPAGYTTQRGYGWEHQQARKRAIAQMRDGDLCTRCGEPMYHGQELHLDHDDDDRSMYRGLAHKLCNLSAGGRRAHNTHSNQRRHARDW